VKNPNDKIQINHLNSKSKSFFRLMIGILFVICHLSFVISPTIAITSDKLIDNAKLYDNTTITIQGECIGDIMARGNHVWVNINDGSSAIGIWAEKELVKDIVHTGSYNFIGDQVKITGAFHRACPVHGGDLDIHAEKIEVLKHGERVHYMINWERLYIAAVLLAVSIILVFYRRKSS